MRLARLIVGRSSVSIKLVELRRHVGGVVLKKSVGSVHRLLQRIGAVAEKIVVEDIRSNPAKVLENKTVWVNADVGENHLRERSTVSESCLRTGSRMALTVMNRSRAAMIYSKVSNKA